MIAFAHRLDRTLLIQARPATVFSFFTDSGRWAAWWGTGSTIDARPGGAMRIRHPGGVEVTGEVLAIEPPERIAFSYGYPSGKPIAVGASRVTIKLDPHPQGTLLQLTHEFADEAARDEMVQGWRYQLSLFANIIANTLNADAAATVDRWFAAWSEPDTVAREQAMLPLVSPAIAMRDRYSSIAGTDDLKAHMTAIHRFMPGSRQERRGEVRHCQWQLLADWVAVGADGQERGRGSTLFQLDADARIAAVTSF
jgi:uncharacterized protein YndB with AHSA1/START domain